MSSRVYPPDDARETAPMPWREIGQTGISVVTAAGPPGAASQPDWERRVAEAHAAGAREGEASGRANAAAELQLVIQRLTRSIDELANLRPRLRREAEADTLRLSLAIARRVLRRELAVDPDAMHGIIIAALEKLQGQEICRVKAHPSVAPLVKASLQQMAGGPGVEVIPDPSREPGAVVFETERGNLDASIDSQLDEIERGLADRLRRQ